MARTTGPQSSSQLAGGHRPPPHETGCLPTRSAHLSQPRLNAHGSHLPRLIVSALLLFLGATGLYVTQTADSLARRTVGVSGSR